MDGSARPSRLPRSGLGMPVRVACPVASTCAPRHRVPVQLAGTPSKPNPQRRCVPLATMPAATIA